MTERHTHRRRVLKGIGASIVGTSLAGCSGGTDGGGGESTDGGGDGDGGNSSGDGGGDSSGNNSGSGGGTTVADGPTEISIVIPHYGLWNTSIHHVVAKNQGFYEEENLKVSRVDTGGDSSTVQTVLSGDADVGHSTGIVAQFAAFRENTDLRIVANAVNTSSATFWYSLGDSTYGSLDTLQGARIGFSSPGSATNVVALKAIKGVKDATAVPVGGPPDANAALENGEVDLAWSVTPFFVKGVKDGTYQTAFRGGDIPPFDSMSSRTHFTTKSAIENKRDAVEAYFRAFTKSYRWAYDNVQNLLTMWDKLLDKNPSGLQNLTEFVLPDGIGAYPWDAVDPTAIKGVDAANGIAAEFDFIDGKLSQKEINTAFNTGLLPGTDEDTFS